MTSLLRPCFTESQANHTKTLEKFLQPSSVLHRTNRIAADSLHYRSCSKSYYRLSSSRPTYESIALDLKDSPPAILQAIRNDRLSCVELDRLLGIRVLSDANLKKIGAAIASTGNIRQMEIFHRHCKIDDRLRRALISVAKQNKHWEIVRNLLDLKSSKVRFETFSIPSISPDSTFRKTTRTDTVADGNHSMRRSLSEPRPQEKLSTRITSARSDSPAISALTKSPMEYSSDGSWEIIQPIKG